MSPSSLRALPPGLELRAATENDVPLLVQLIREIAEYEHLTHEVACDEKLLHEALFGKRRGAEALLASVGGETAGYAVFFHNFSTFAGRAGLYLEDLFIRPQYRRRGYGRAILGHLARLAVERGCARFEWAVLDWNRPAIDFYEQLGARVMPDWRVCRLEGDRLQALAAQARG